MNLEWIEKKAKLHVYDLLDLRPEAVGLGVDNDWVKKTKSFIRDLLKELPKKPIVTQEFVKKWAEYFAEYPSQHRLEEILQWSGVEVCDE